MQETPLNVVKLDARGYRMGAGTTQMGTGTSKLHEEEVAESLDEPAIENGRLSRTSDNSLVSAFR